MYEFGTDGTFVGKSIGYGRGPQESLVKHCDCFAMSDEGEIALFGSNLDFEYFSKDRKVANRFWIYKDGRLTADTEVPKGLIVTGYSAPYYYSQVFDANGHFRSSVRRRRPVNAGGTGRRCSPSLFSPPCRSPSGRH